MASEKLNKIEQTNSPLPTATATMREGGSSLHLQNIGQCGNNFEVVIITYSGRISKFYQVKFTQYFLSASVNC